MATLFRLVLALPLVAMLGGCAWLEPESRGRSPLSPIKLAPDAAQLEVIFARHTFDQAELNQPLWDQVDELQLSSETRAGLAQNGLRAGVISGALPSALERLVKNGSIAVAQPAGNAAEPSNSLDGLPSRADGAANRIDAEPTVRTRTLHARSGQRSELLASGIYDQLPLLMREEGQVRGKTYSQAQGLFVLKAAPQGDGRVRLNLLPEIQHGDSKQHWIGDDGVFRLESGRAKLAFDKLAIDLTLAPGQSLLLASRSDRPGSLGHYFFTESGSGQLHQKLLLIRLDESKYNDQFVLERAPAVQKSLEFGVRNAE